MSPFMLLAREATEQMLASVPSRPTAAKSFASTATQARPPARPATKPKAGPNAMQLLAQMIRDGSFGEIVRDELTRALGGHKAVSNDPPCRPRSVASADFMSQADRERTRHWRDSFHEAGHATVALLTGLPLVKVSMGCASTDAACSVTEKWPSNFRGHVNSLAFELSGLAAQRLLLRHENGVEAYHASARGDEAGNDLAAAKKHLERLIDHSKKPREITEDLLQVLVNILSDCIATTPGMTAAVREVAAALREKHSKSISPGSMTGLEVGEILQRHVDLTEAPHAFQAALWKNIGLFLRLPETI